MQHAVCSMQCAEYSVQYAVCSVQCAVCSVQCAVCAACAADRMAGAGGHIAGPMRPACLGGLAYWPVLGNRFNLKLDRLQFNACSTYKNLI